MFSKEAIKHAEACRFCWMCRHICPVANSTGNEGWTPRAKGLMVSMIERGTEFDVGIADAMYHCTFCEACANDCATGFKPSEYIRAARTQALVEGIAPTVVTDTIDRIMDTGSIFTTDAEAEYDSDTDAKVLLYMGQTVRAQLPEMGKQAAGILRKAGVQVQVMEKEPDSGTYLAELMGFTGDVQNVAKETAQAIKVTGATTLVVLNPADAHMFRDQYGKWDLLKGMEIVTFTAFTDQLMAEGKLKGAAVNRKASLHEPVKLTRGLEEELPVKNLLAAAGVENIEMFLHGKMSRCIGTVPFAFTAPAVVKEMVRVRVEDALRMESNAIVTASPDDYYIMKKYAQGIEILDLVELLFTQC